ncbi:Bifunctional protein GlmU [uncultured archaeon]|nr:Bifunctional protein GlmU [uncultured archaeon]
MNHSYKVCVVAAGIGAHMGDITDTLNKALLPLSHKAVISHILEEFPPTVPVVVVVGYQKDTLMQYLKLAHPERTFEFVEVDKFSGPGSGPGHSLLAAKNNLQCPFLLTTIDTIVQEKPKAPNYNWVGVSPVEDTSRFCSFNIKDGAVAEIYDKVRTSNKYAFIGLAGIKDYAEFWESLEADQTLIGGEVQWSNGLEALVKKTLVVEPFTWHDTGTLESYQATCRALRSEFKNFDKKGEEIFFVGGRVVKYFQDSKIIADRVERNRILEGLVPKLVAHTPNFYAYERVEGRVLAAELTLSKFQRYLEWLSANLWSEKSLPAAEQEKFRAACLDLYKNNPAARLEKFYKKTRIHDGVDIINGVKTPPLAEMLQKVDWDSLAAGVPSRFHGDLQFDNVVVPASGKPEFVLLDWRHEFAGLKEHGDLYYDLGKLYYAVNMSHEAINRDLFSVQREGERVSIDFYSKYSISACKPLFEKFILSRGYSLNKVKLIHAIIHLNMSPLHHNPFDELLYYLGKLELYECLYQKV